MSPGGVHSPQSGVKTHRVHKLSVVGEGDGRAAGAVWESDSAGAQRRYAHGGVAGGDGQPLAVHVAVCSLNWTHQVRPAGERSGAEHNRATRLRRRSGFTTQPKRLPLPVRVCCARLPTAHGVHPALPPPSTHREGDGGRQRVGRRRAPVPVPQHLAGPARTVLAGKSVHEQHAVAGEGDGAAGGVVEL